MGKQQVRKYLNNLPKEDLVEQLIELYISSKEVKKFYDFLIKPNTQKVVNTWKEKIGKEYFPLNGRRPKARRSVAQKAVKEMDYLRFPAELIADMRLFGIEMAIVYTEGKNVKNQAFFHSFARQFSDCLTYLSSNGILSDFKLRCRTIVEQVKATKWTNADIFEKSYAATFLTKQD